MRLVPPAVRGFWGTLPLCLILVLLSGCLPGFLPGVGGGPEVATRSLEVIAAPDANQESPVPVDLVLLRSEPLVALIAGLTARQWFDQRSQLLRDHPKDLDYRAWEFVPGQVATIDEFPFESRKGVALFVFADYLSEGAHRVRVDPLEKFRLRLEAGGFVVEPME